MPQTKTGYLKGCRGLILTPLNSDGSMPATPQKHAVKTSQSVSVELETVEGESGELRGGDRVLARFEENDVVVGANLTFTDARFDAQAAQIIGGGKLVYEEVQVTGDSVGTGDGTTTVFTLANQNVVPGSETIYQDGTPVSSSEYTIDDETGTITFNTAPAVGVEITADYTYEDQTKINGWEAPKVTEQDNRIPFQCEVYVANYNASGGLDGYLKYTFPYCIGYAPGIEHQDQEWGTPEFEIRARENPSTGASYVKKVFVDQLPTELQ